MRVVVLISGSGTNMAALLSATAEPGYDVSVVAVGADRAASGLDHARSAGVATFVCALADHADRAEWDAALCAQLDSYAPDLVVCAGFMRLLGPVVLGRHTFLNIHPALLPAFPGAHAVRDALAYGVRYTGTTIHFVDEGVDTGPVLEQVPVEVHPHDDEASLHERVKIAERRLLVEVVGRLAREGWQLEGRQVRYGTSVAQRAR